MFPHFNLVLVLRQHGKHGDYNELNMGLPLELWSFVPTVSDVVRVKPSDRKLKCLGSGIRYSACPRLGFLTSFFVTCLYPRTVL